MIGYATVGVDDMQKAERFYSAFLLRLGYRLQVSAEGLSHALPVVPGQSLAAPDFYVEAPVGGKPASAGNGTMVAFDAATRQRVRELHAAALAAGGSNEGAPGVRAAYSADFYVGYLRDPQGNKLAPLLRNSLNC